MGATAPRSLTVLALCAAVLAACQDSDPESDDRDAAGSGRDAQVLTLSVETAPGVIEYDRKRLSARAGQIVFELINGKRRGHNIRIPTGDRCCFPPGSRDVGGTRTIGTGRTRAVVHLRPGTYTYLCSAGGHWRTQHGTLVVH
jgi:plastocyanin